MIYLDHNATAPLRPSARRAMLAALDQTGNASSVHAAGRKARALVEAARETVARFAGAKPSEVVFTSGASEANAAALRCAIAGALADEDRITRLFVSGLEHESVRATALSLSETVPGLKLNEIPVLPDGRVDLTAFRMALMHGKGRALISAMAANNETGVVQDLGALTALLKVEGGENPLLHVDAVQCAGKAPLAFAAWGADYLTLSAHKFGGPQGVGALLIKDGAPFASLIAGGGQEMGRRAGTENVASIAGFAAAAEEAADFESEMARQKTLRDAFEAALKEMAPETTIFGNAVPRLANTSNFAIPGLAAEIALIALDLDGIALSSGSACSSGTIKPSHVLKAMGVEDTLARCALRASFGWNSSALDVEALLVALRRLLARRSGLKAA